ncbi:MAG: ribosome-associated translation inhibitor RaiA [Deltaproteobacteria bacterium]|nr:ribosome-associated translation inhibitor RaiA [Deltaproteobacteria bacterium]
MRLELIKNNVEVPEALSQVIDHKAEKVKERLKRYHPDVADLEVKLEFNDKLKTYECVLHLKAFRDVLHASKSAEDLRESVDKGFDALMRELEHYRVKINKSL